MIHDHFLFTALIPRVRLKDQTLKSFFKVMDDGTDVLFACDEVSAEGMLDPEVAEQAGRSIGRAYNRALERRAEREMDGSALKDEGTVP